jgi:hypothetical protein
MPSDFKLDLKPLEVNVLKLTPKIHSRLTAGLSYVASNSRRELKKNAPWRDRTANARNGLNAKHIRAGATHYVVLYHQVNYGIWLEVAHNGRYRVIIPTMTNYSMPAVGSVLTGLFGAL